MLIKSALLIIILAIAHQPASSGAGASRRYATHALEAGADDASRYGMDVAHTRQLVSCPAGQYETSSGVCVDCRKLLFFFEDGCHSHLGRRFLRRYLRNLTYSLI